MSSGTDTYASDASAVPLLTALLERAETALGASTSAAVPIDSELIRAALAESSDGRTTPEVRARVCELFALQRAGTSEDQIWGASFFTRP